MRGLAAFVAIGAVCVRVAAADEPADRVRVGAAVGAGGQGTASYGALELRLDALWRGVRIGLGGRAVWLDGELRDGDWERTADAVTLVRHVEAHAGPVAIAAGGLAPSQLAHVADGYRAALDDRLRTGARGAVTTSRVRLGLEIDDVLDPALVGGALAVQLTTPWTLHAAAAIDPTVPMGPTRSALEVGAAHRWDAPDRRFEVGGAVVGEPHVGLGVVAFGAAAMDHAGARWTATADLRGGNGTNGAAFGPLYRAERAMNLDTAHTGVGAGLTLGAHAPAGWVTAGLRARPGLGALATVAAGAPMGRYVQAGGWVAASPDLAAGAAELRIAWARRLFSAFELARMVQTDDAMAPLPAWSLTAWFGAATE
jgi:hypothetical protein